MNRFEAKTRTRGYKEMEIGRKLARVARAMGSHAIEKREKKKRKSDLRRSGGVVAPIRRCTQYRLVTSEN